jgi:predicted Zn finger-like uncharacterized protein
MLITCPSCSSRYDIDTQKIGAMGRQVRCSQCRTSFFVTPEGTSTPSVDRGEPESQKPQKKPPAKKEQANSQENSQATFQEALAASSASEDNEPVSTAAVESSEDDSIHWPLPKGDLASAVREENGSKLSFSALTSKPEKLKTRAANSRFGSLFSKIGLKLSAPFRVLPSALNAVIVCAVVFGLVYTLRERIVRTLPQTAKLYAMVGMPVNLRGLTLEDVQTQVVAEGEGNILVVEGQIRNITPRTVSLPLIQLSLNTQDHQTLYTWTVEPQRPKLKAGELLPFRARLASPPPESHDVLVRFSARDPNSAPITSNPEAEAKALEAKAQETTASKEAAAANSPHYPERAIMKKDE